MSYRAENNAVVLTIESIDFNGVGISLFPAIPPNLSFACTGCVVTSKTYTALSGGTISIGTSGSGYIDIVSSANLNTFTAVNQSVSYSINIPAVIAGTGSQIGLQTNPLGLPPGPFTGSVTLLGFYF